MTVMPHYHYPVLTAQGRTLPEAWEKAVRTVWEQGTSVATEYDKKGDPPSKDGTMVIVVEEPMAEPRIHRAFPGGLEDLEIYRQEVVFGIHDNWIKPEEGKWTYTYHQRIFNYPGSGEEVDQIEAIIRKLSEVPYSRRAQAITWSPSRDALSHDPPCLQRLWFRIIDDANHTPRLVMNAHWRSRDAFKAAFMNMFALTDLQNVIASRIRERTGRALEPGSYVDISDSFHIYGSYHEEFSRFLKTVRARSFEEKTWHSQFAESYFDDARKKIQAEKSGET